MKFPRNAGLVLLVLHLGGCSTANMRMDFDGYCQSAGLSIVERLSGPQRMLLDRSGITHREYARSAPSSFLSFVGAKNVEYVDEKTTTGTRYRRYRKSLRFEVVRETDANLLLKFESLTSIADQESDLFGEQMTISDRLSGRVVATYRYFWRTGYLADYCPKNRAGALNPGAVVAYVTGPEDPGNQAEKYWHLPLPQ